MSAYLGQVLCLLDKCRWDVGLFTGSMCWLNSALSSARSSSKTSPLLESRKMHRYLSHYSAAMN
jgi:hypothetical protein